MSQPKRYRNRLPEDLRKLLGNQESMIYLFRVHLYLVAVAKLVPSGVLCLISALSLHELTTEIPHEIYVAIARGAGRADAGPGIRPVASLLGLDFLPIRWERFDLLISKDRFFEQGVQYFQALLHENSFVDMARNLDGYDVGGRGVMQFPT